MAEDPEVAQVTEQFGPLRVTITGANLGNRLVSGEATADKPQDLAAEERIPFFQRLAVEPYEDVKRVIGRCGEINDFLEFLFEEARRRQKLDNDRKYWAKEVKIRLENVFSGSIPSESTVADSSDDFVQFPCKLPAVCPAILRCRSFLTFHEVLKAESKRATECLLRWREFLSASNKSCGTELLRCDAVFEFFKDWM